MPATLTALNAETGDVVAAARRALVQVKNGHEGHGAGTIWHEHGMIMTNAHVVGDGHNLHVVLHDGTELAARVAAYDRSLDLAALRVDAEDLPTMPWGDSQALQAGQWVMAIGHPWGVVGAVTGGVVIGVDATLPGMPQTDADWIAVSLKMRPGHSGGALINTDGELLGVNTMISGPSVGLAVPVHVVRRFLHEQITA